jgi:hypothetical protein
METKIKYLLVVNLILGALSATAQTQIWPTADTNTINASQFKGVNSLFTLTRTDTVVPATHKGWYTKGLTSANAAKTDSAVWKWNTNGTSIGAYGAGSLISSPTVANGAVTFDSDWLDNKGVPLPAGDGIGQAPSPHAGELVSPIMDARGFSNVTLRFNQVFRNFAAATYVSWSEDSGRTWKPNIRLNADLTSNNATAFSAIATVKLIGSVGTSGFRVKFVFDGDYYYWSIDDVKLILISNDLKISSFYSIAPNYITAKRQMEDMKFMLDIDNNGNTATHVKAKVFVYRVDAGPALTQIYSDSLDYGTVRGDTTIQKKIFPNKFLTSNLSIGAYYARYRIASDSIDQNPANDTIGFGFQISDSLYWKESGSITVTRPSDAYWTANERHSWRAGNYYYAKSGTTCPLSSLTVRLGDPSLIRGERVSAGMYEWTDLNSDGIIQAGERILVAYGDLLIPQSQPVGNIWIQIPVRGINTMRAFYLQSNKQYLAMIEFDPTNSNLNMTIGYNRGIHDYSGMIFMTDSLARAGVTGFRPRYAGILGKKIDDDWSTVDFGYGMVPTVRMSIIGGFCDGVESLSADYKMEIYPNPTSETVTLSVDLPKVVPEIRVQMLNLDGRLLQEQVFKHLQVDDLTLNLEHLTSGIYLLRILTPDGTRMKKLIVAK